MVERLKEGGRMTITSRKWTLKEKNLLKLEIDQDQNEEKVTTQGIEVDQNQEIKVQNLNQETKKRKCLFSVVLVTEQGQSQTIEGRGLNLNTEDQDPGKD